MLGPRNFTFATISLERHPRLALHRFVVVAHKAKASDQGVTNALAFSRAILDRRKPMTVFYDLCRLHAATKVAQTEQRSTVAGGKWLDLALSGEHATPTAPRSSLQSPSLLLATSFDGPLSLLKCFCFL